MRPSCPLLKHGFTRRHLIECRPGNLDPPLVQRSLKGLNQSPLKIPGQESGLRFIPSPGKSTEEGEEKEGEKILCEKTENRSRESKEGSETLPFIVLLTELGFLLLQSSILVLGQLDLTQQFLILQSQSAVK
ncbi:hypothetical protein NL676_028214 [Syzygium grande]|nr:hypothetical protein NL676_028214 [Syzygium grande]